MYARKERAHEKLPSSPTLDRPTTRAARERKGSGSQPSMPAPGATTPTYVPGDSRMVQREFLLFLGILASGYTLKILFSFSYEIFRVISRVVFIRSIKFIQSSKR